jgi:SWI/SNF-related matrix-associated actin-dependent regulator of chromatin subfamily A-like protein 1
MEKKIPEIEAQNILSTYEGANNQLIEWRTRLLNSKSFRLTRPQSDYVLKYHQITPKIARKYINIVISFGEKIQEEKLLPKPLEKIWCEKLLCESDKAFHIWGKYFDSEQNHAFWLPKGAVLQPEKKLNRVIDYSKYSHRPPKEYQKPAIERLLANDKYILADDMGLGKTTSAIIASEESGSKKVLIVCPASLKINWRKEIKNYSDEKVLIVEGRKWGSTFKYYIINYDILKNYHTTEKLEDSDDYQLIANEGFDLAIIDEAHYISNTTAQRTKLLTDILLKIPKVWLLTGTPMTSRPINYFNLLKIVGSSVALNWQHYVKRYCKGFRFKVNGRTIWNTSGHSNLDELRERTKNLVLRRLKTEVGDLPDKTISEIFLELKSTFYNEELEEFMRITKDNKDKATLRKENHEKEENENVAAVLGRLMKVRQVISYEKIPYTCELIDKAIELDKKVLVFTNFTMTLDMLHEKYKKNSVILDGRMSKEKKEEAKERFQNDPKIKVFILNIIAGGVGHNLTAAEVVIMNDLSSVPGHHSQAEDRAFREGQKKNVMVYYPIFENTIEQIVYNILQSKKNVIDQVMGDGEYSENFGKEFIKSLF